MSAQTNVLCAHPECLVRAPRYRLPALVCLLATAGALASGASALSISVDRYVDKLVEYVTFVRVFVYYLLCSRLLFYSLVWGKGCS